MDRKMKAGKCGSIFLLLLMVITSSLPLSGAERLPSKNIVIIDPAHGGDDKGVKLSDNQYEKDINLRIAQALQKELQASGKTAVLLTRTDDRDIPVAERIKMIRSAGAKLVISIHINAGFGKKAAGYEVYFPGFNTVPAGNGAEEIIKDMQGNKHLNESVALAQNVMHNLQNIFPRKERGLREAPVPVLEGLTLPAVAVEIGFATNIEDKKIITDEKGQKAVALALSKSVREFLTHQK